MLVQTTRSRRAPLEVRAARARRASAARRVHRAGRQRALRRRLVSATVATCALVIVPTASDATRVATAARPVNRCALPAELRGDFVSAARATLLPLGLLAGVARVESEFSEDAQSPAGAVGVMQVMPSTASALHYDPFDATSNVLAGAVYLRQLLVRYGGDLELALAAYNAGPTAVDRAGGAPSGETRAYVDDVERAWHAYGTCS